jgi:hypothetical protein
VSLFNKTLRVLLHQVLVDGEGDPTGTSSSPQDLVLAAFGRTRRGAVDTASAAAELGVSQRSVGRWIKGDRRPTAEHLKSMRKKARQASSTKAGRSKAASKARQPTKPVFITITGDQGPSDYERADRTTTNQLTKEEIIQLRAAYVAGGERAVMNWLTAWMARNYVPEWNFLTVTDIELKF